MLGSLLILLAMPLLDDGRGRGDVHRPVSRIAFWVFVGIFFLLMFLGSQHAEEPYITVGAIATAAYFLWFVMLLPIIGMMENSSFDGSNAPASASAQTV